LRLPRNSAGANLFADPRRKQAGNIMRKNSHIRTSAPSFQLWGSLLLPLEKAGRRNFPPCCLYVFLIRVSFTGTRAPCVVGLRNKGGFCMTVLFWERCRGRSRTALAFERLTY
jgi:hypothetical protein